MKRRGFIKALAGLFGAAAVGSTVKRDLTVETPAADTKGWICTGYPTSFGGDQSFRYVAAAFYGYTDAITGSIIRMDATGSSFQFLDGDRLVTVPAGHYWQDGVIRPLERKVTA